MMGKFPAVLPGDLRYARTNHMWCRESAGRLRFGFSSYAVRLMQDVYFLDWVVNEGDQIKHLEQIGHIETSKAVADLFESYNTVYSDRLGDTRVDVVRLFGPVEATRTNVLRDERKRVTLKHGDDGGGVSAADIQARRGGVEGE